MCHMRYVLNRKIQSIDTQYWYQWYPSLWYCIGLIPRPCPAFHCLQCDNPWEGLGDFITWVMSKSAEGGGAAWTDFASACFVTVQGLNLIIFARWKKKYIHIVHPPPLCWQVPFTPSLRMCTMSLTPWVSSYRRGAACWWVLVNVHMWTEFFH